MSDTEQDRASGDDTSKSAAGAAKKRGGATMVREHNYRQTEIGNMETYEINPFLPVKADGETMDDLMTHFVIEKIGLINMRTGDRRG